MIQKEKILISPSILAADFSKLGQEIQDVDQAGADYIHIDVMDGNFVPNITIGPDVIASLRIYTKKIFDVHLMIDKPEKYIEQFAQAGADIITIHYEATTHIHSVIKKIKSLGIKAGISIVPTTSENVLQYLMDEIDLVLVMTVNPGFGGQKFITSQLKKIQNIKQNIVKMNKNILLEVDGGINADNVKQVIQAGANVIVSGSFIFNGKNKTQYQKNIQMLKQ